ncbi:hypothetical protein C2G38_1110716 [Gigaspora rosea]|uniref:Uncharacterized protein n=1 Tax=Gigaspora rosea TaxID=44941 RepID=A0A397VN40_9GLOM|nr:hypothetical protein C2G38_1110716 [Gigaspora rosea]
MVIYSAIFKEKYTYFVINTLSPLFVYDLNGRSHLIQIFFSNFLQISFFLYYDIPY